MQLYTRMVRGMLWVYICPGGGGVRSRVCPRWVHTLQCAELDAALHTFQLAAYMGWNMAVLGSDSWVSRAQAISVRASSGLPAQHRVLRRFFWFRAWTSLSMSIF